MLDFVLWRTSYHENSTEYKDFWLNSVTHLLGGISTTESFGDHSQKSHLSCKEKQSAV